MYTLFSIGLMLLFPILAQVTALTPAFMPSADTVSMEDAPQAIHSLPGNENWADGFNVPGVNNEVMALALDSGGSLYVGGEFSSAGNGWANRIARWNGSAWSALGSGVDGSVNALAVGPSGVVYAGGGFTSAGGVSTNHVAQWNGSVWSALGSGLDSTSYQPVHALAADGQGNLYVGGDFVSAGGVSASYIAKWDGFAWSSLALGVNGVVRALAVADSGHLYVGGDFTTAGGLPIAYLAMWDGAAWSAVGSGVNGAVSALAIGPGGDLCASGTFDTAGGIPANNIALWNGTDWSALGPGLQFNAWAVAVDANGFVYAGGGYWSAEFPVIGRWDGTAWLPLGTGLNSHSFFYSPYLNALVVDQTNHVFAGGYFLIAGGAAARGVAQWDGSNWSALGGGNGISRTGRTALVDQNSDLIVGGDLEAAGRIEANGMARWNGSVWSALRSFSGAGYAIDQCLAAAEGNSGDLYVAHNTFNPYWWQPTFIDRWNGAGWTTIGETSSLVQSVVVDENDNILAGGDFTSISGVVANAIAVWDGASWTELGGGLDGSVASLTFDDNGNLFAAGAFSVAGGVSVSNIAMWDGVAWSDLGGGLNGPVSTLAIDDNGNLYAGGSFTTAGGVPASKIAKWDGVAWSDLDVGISGTSSARVNALALDQAGNLYAGGWFAAAGDVPASSIARWDGQEWTALGAGINGVVYALATDSAGNLYVVGGFSSAGDRVASGIARWTAATAQHNLVAGGTYTFYPENLPINVHVADLGTLSSIIIQRFDQSHPDSTVALETGSFWSIQALDSSGNPAVGYTIDLTLSTAFTPDGYDQICRRVDTTWNCAADGFDPIGRTITRFNVTELSDWTVKNLCGLTADFDESGVVDVNDLVAIGNRWLWTTTSPDWDPVFDLRRDNRIDVVDIQLTAAQWNNACP